ncbi:hypothetical protein MKS88_000937 [Plasmodium brasilianum]|nr:conserved Plasmodium protein, unknown function [Plasmodium malariae]KAI4840702.1 hypothetical protein MKS88_000937 [Plasmodium brasilianum]SBT86267.1 conserved Plasmodium protein, unknown function [Plasmodium malariae]
MLIEKRIDNRNFDFVLPVHVDIDEINEYNKTCKYISGNINPEVYSKNTNNTISTIIGGEQNYDLVESSKKILLGNGMSSIVTSTLIGPVPNNLMFSKGVESVQFNIRIKNIQGCRNEREKMFEELITKMFEQILDNSLYKFQLFNIRIQILCECTFILSSIINSVMLNFIHNNISLNYVIAAVNIGIVDQAKYKAYIEERRSLSIHILDQVSSEREVVHKWKEDDVRNEWEAAYELHKHKLFYEQRDGRYIPQIIVDPLNSEIDLYCSSAFCFIIAPEFHKVISNILIKQYLGISRGLFNLSKSYACQASKLLHENIRKNFTAHLKKIETSLHSNYF